MNAHASNASRPFNATILSLLTASLLLVACGDDASRDPDASAPDGDAGARRDSGADDEAPKIDYELFDNTTVLDARSLEQLASISEDQVTLRFDSTSPQLAALSAGNVIVGGVSDNAQPRAAGARSRGRPR
jgi:hypothetical protein